MRVFDFNSAIVRSPGRSVVDGLRATPGPSPDFETVALEHRTYIAALESAGVHVTVLDALERFPDSIFVEDPALVFSQSAILLRPAAPSRMAEAAELEAALSPRFPRLLRLTEGFADGGDILATPRKIFIGLSARTNETGAAALRTLLGAVGLGSEVVRVPDGVLHLKTAASLIDEDTILSTSALAGSGMLADFRMIAVPDDESAAANAVRVNDTLFIRAGFPRTHELLVRHGSRVVALPISEIARIDAGLSCMSLRWFDPDRGNPRAPRGVVAM